MASGKTRHARPPAYSRIALGLLACGLVLGALWALSLAGLAIDLLVHLLR